MTVMLPVPCLHRIHAGMPAGSLAVQHSLGVSIELVDLGSRLDRLEREARRLGRAERSVLVTFDDGWTDPMALASRFASWPRLQPVLFLTMRHMAGDRSLLPLHRLYEWCAATGTSLAEMERAGVTRKEMKSRPEHEQHAWLDRIGVPRSAESSDVLSDDDIKVLMNDGWLQGSHGHDHHDLRFDEPDALLGGLRDAFKTVISHGGEPWLAWPEGRCTMDTCEIAQQAGFERQFSLRAESGSIRREDLIHRDIWR